MRRFGRVSHAPHLGAQREVVRLIQELVRVGAG
jgi:hypothetical protein